MLVRYTATKKCARSLVYQYPSPIIGQLVVTPDKVPFIQIGGESPEEEDPSHPLDYLHRFPSTAETSERCDQNEPPSFDGAHHVEGFIHLGGEYHPDPFWGSHIGLSMSTIPYAITSRKFWVAGKRTFYDTNKSQHIAHKPHKEKTLEICTVIKGRLNYAMAAECEEYFDVVSLKQGQVAVLFPDIYHTNSANTRESGEHMCFKIFPTNQGSMGTETSTANALAASRIATGSMNVDVETHFRSEKQLTIFNSQE